MGDLVHELGEASDAATPLGDRLERVRKSAEAIWALPRLPWFTDHTAHRHSRRLIALLGQIADHLQHTDQRLKRAELYILLSACYLHDIGMQDISVDGHGGKPRSWDELGPDDYEEVRRRHPARGRDLIVRRSLSPERDELRVDLDDLPDYLIPIALVSQGHGSSYFEDTVAKLDEGVWAPDGEPIRGSLLTALLMMADELDLGSERTSFPTEAALSALSELHHFLNHFVTLSEVVQGANSKRRQARIRFEFPPDSEDYRPDVRQAIADKLVAQARRANGVIERATDGELVFEEAVEISEQTDTTGVRRRPGGAALAELRRQLRRSELVGRDDVAGTLEGRLDPKGPPSVVSLACEANSDLNAVIRWLQADANVKGFRVRSVAFRPTIGRDADSVLRELAEDLGVGATSPRPAEVAAALAAQPTLLLFTDFDAVDRVARVTMLELVAAFVDVGDPGLVLIAHDGSAEIAADVELRLSAIERDALENHLRSEHGYDEEGAARHAERSLSLSGGAAALLTATLRNDRLACQVDG